MFRKQQTIVYILVVLAIVALGAVVHEAGHAITAVASGSKIVSFGMIPGIQLYPEFKRIEWNRCIAYLEHTGTSYPWQRGLMLIMGAGATSGVGYLAIAGLFAFRPKGVVRFALLGIAVFYALDIITYSLFPPLGLRHWILVGGDYPEPVVGGEKLGISRPIYYACLAFHIVVYYGLIVFYLARKRCKGLTLGTNCETP